MQSSLFVGFYLVCTVINGWFSTDDIMPSRIRNPSLLRNDVFVCVYM